MRQSFDTLATKTLAFATILTLGTGCSSSRENTVTGNVTKGADGNFYVVPDTAERALYQTKDACVSDTSMHEAEINKATGAEVDANNVCHQVSEYQPTPNAASLPPAGWLGIIVPERNIWSTSIDISWVPVGEGKGEGIIVLRGEMLQNNIVPAPPGAVPPKHITVFRNDEQ